MNYYNPLLMQQGYRPMLGADQNEAMRQRPFLHPQLPPGGYDSSGINPGGGPLPGTGMPMGGPMPPQAMPQMQTGDPAQPMRLARMAGPRMPGNRFGGGLIR